MSSSQHPVALSIERRVGDAGKLLAVVMCLPLVDGLFPALVLAGSLDSLVGILEVGLLVFGGSATVAILIAEMDGGPREQSKIVLAVGALLIPVAVVEAALAPTLAGVLNLAVFERFAGIVILAVAASTASATVGEYLPRPAVIVGLGLVASLDPANAVLVVDVRPALLVSAAGAAGIGVGFALVVGLVSPWLRNAVDLDRFRFGSAVALGVLTLSIYGLVPENAPLALAVLVVTAIFAFDPGSARERDREYRPDEIDVTAALSDGGTGDGDAVGGGAVDDGEATVEPDSERLPWL
jgi:hypothetical protein